MSPKQAIDQIADKAPSLAAMVLVIGIGGGLIHVQTKEFTRYLEQDQQRSEALGSLRISVCHDIQRDSLAVTKELSESLRSQERAFVKLIAEIEDLAAEIKRGNK